ncbi:hypothetical protein Tco_1559274, partial [Tanacetum coccineum]
RVIAEAKFVKRKEIPMHPLYRDPVRPGHTILYHADGVYDGFNLNEAAASLTNTRQGSIFLINIRYEYPRVESASILHDEVDVWRFVVCKAIFDNDDASFLKGLLEHTSAAQQQLQSTRSPFSLDLRIRDIIRIFCLLS